MSKFKSVFLKIVSIVGICLYSFVFITLKLLHWTLDMLGSPYEQVEVYESEYFKYVFLRDSVAYYDKNDDSVAIVGFTSAGLKKYSLHIPKKIDGHIVKQIGLAKTDAYIDGERYFYKSWRVQFDVNHAKVFFYDNIEELNLINVSNDGRDVVVTSTEIRNAHWLSRFDNLYVYKEYVEFFKFYNDNAKAANVVFMNNYPGIIDSGYYGLDYTYYGHRIEKLLDPELEGYQFTGWFTEPECINEWDFNQVPIIEEEFKLYAGWSFM